MGLQAAFGIRECVHGCLVHGRVVEHHRFDLVQLDPVAPSLDLAIPPAHEGQVALLGRRHEVTCRVIDLDRPTDALATCTNAVSFRSGRAQ
jgi:hypothetical protein